MRPAKATVGTTTRNKRGQPAKATVAAMAEAGMKTHR